MSESEKKQRQEYKEKRQKRIFVQLIAITVILVIALSSFVVYRQMNKTYYIHYTENGTVSYKVRLNDNEFYKEEWLDSNHSYVTALIGSIDATMKYELMMETKGVDFEYNYAVNATMLVTNKQTGEAIYDPTYAIVPESTHSLSDESGVYIKENIDIDYGKYNDQAISFINKYSLKNIASAMLVVTMDVDIISSCSEFDGENANSYSVSLNIPLAEQTTSMYTSSSAPAGEEKVLACKGKVNQNIFKGIAIGSAAVDAVLLCLFVAFVYFTRNEDINYGIEVKRILSAYRSYIQQITGGFDSTGYQQVRIKTFKEMLAIRDTIQSPILMNENEDQTHTEFLIPTNTKILYIFDIKVKNYDEIYGRDAVSPESDIDDLDDSEELSGAAAPAPEAFSAVSSAEEPACEIIAEPAEAAEELTVAEIIPEAAEEPSSEEMERITVEIEEEPVREVIIEPAEEIVIELTDAAEEPEEEIIIELAPDPAEESGGGEAAAEGVEEPAEEASEESAEPASENMADAAEEVISFRAESVPEAADENSDEYNSALSSILEHIVEIEAEGDNENSAIAYIDEGGNVINITCTRSFTANLIQSNPQVKSYYNALKNHILSYKGVKARMSWRLESYNKGRIQLFKMKIRGKTVCLYCALDPAEFDRSKYFQETATAKNFAQVPMMVRIRSDRALKRAKGLIDKVMERFSILTDPKASERDFVKDYPYESTKSLVEKRLIKLLLPDAVAAEPKPYHHVHKKTLEVVHGDVVEEIVIFDADGVNEAEIEEMIEAPTPELSEIDYDDASEKIGDFHETAGHPGVDVIGVVWPERPELNKIYRYDPDGHKLSVGDVIIVPTRDNSRNRDVMRKVVVAHANHLIDPDELKFPLKKIIGVLHSKHLEESASVKE